MSSTGRDAPLEEAQDITLYGEVECIHRWIRRANEVLGRDEGDESSDTVVAFAVADRFKNALAYLNDPLRVRLEGILRELRRIKQLVG